MKVRVTTVSRSDIRSDVVRADVVGAENRRGELVVQVRHRVLIRLEERLPGVREPALEEGLETEVLDGGKGVMRKEDHQFLQPIYISSFGSRTDKEPFDEEGTGWGWKVVAKVDTAQATLPTTCKMKRP